MTVLIRLIYLKIFWNCIFSFSCKYWTLYIIYNDIRHQTIYATSAYHHWCCEFGSRSGRGIQHYVIKFVSALATGRWFSPGPQVSSSNKTYRHDITEIVLKVALNTIKPKPISRVWPSWHSLLFLSTFVQRPTSIGNLWLDVLNLQKVNLFLSFKMSK